MLRRTAQILSVVFAAASLAGCLGDFSGQYGPQGSTGSTSMPDPSGSNGNNGNPDPSGGAGGSAGVGGAGGSGGSTVTPPVDMGPPAQVGTLSLMLSMDTDSIRLNESKDYQVMLVPAGGFDGAVNLTADNLPTGVTATFNPATVMVSQMTTVTMTVKTAANTTPATGNAITINAVSGTINANAKLTLDVKAELLVTIPKGVDIGTNASPNLTAFGAQTINTIFVAPGTKVTFVNADSINHEIHSDGSLGIAHEGGPLMANEGNSYTQTFNATGTFNFRCHIHPNMIGQIVVK